MTLFRIVSAALVPVLFAAIFYLLEKKTRFKKLPYISRQIIIGIVFGGIAILATEFGIQIDGAVLNVRTAAPVTAGLLFGGPAGIIAGVIGGVERYFATYWGVGEFTQIACSTATVFAGFAAAAVRKLLLENKKASWLYGFVVGATVEVFHMFLVFFTNADDLVRAFTTIQNCAIPMIVSNSLSVMCAIIVVSLLTNQRQAKKVRTKKIAQTFQYGLMITVVAAFVATMIFTQFFQSTMAKAQADETLLLNIEDVKNDIEDASDHTLLDLVYEIRQDEALPEDISAVTPSVLQSLSEKYNVVEINYINEKGIVAVSNSKKNIGFDMASDEQSRAFVDEIFVGGAEYYVQEYRSTALDNSTNRKFAAILLDNGAMFQVGYDAEQFYEVLGDAVVTAAKNRHIGQSGCIIICDENGIIVSDRDNHEGEQIEALAAADVTMKEGVRYEADIYDVPSYCMYSSTEGYYIIGVLPVAEALYSRTVAMYIFAFLEIIVFGIFFLLVYFLVKRVVVDNIYKVNNSLAQITGGNLDVTVDVRSNEEFVSLSDDINSTVDTLKRYIDEAAARIDKELEYAKSIQLSALPSKFPPFPEKPDFDIYAQMIAAKEVGGDFYDFYMLDDNTVAFLCADVSGKGIPAAMFMMQAKTIIKELAERGLPVNDIFTLANQKLCDGNESGMFVTAWMGILDLKNGLLQYTNAGHNPPLILRAGGDFEYLKARAGFVLGGMDSIKYRINELTLTPGDRIFLYTDGVTEATDTNNKLYGEDRLAVFMNKNKKQISKDLLPNLKKDIDIFVGDAPQFDDITMLMFDYKQEKEASGMVEKVFTAEDDSLPEVLSFVEEELEKADCSPKISMQIAVAIEEIFVNIAHYAYPDNMGTARLKIGFDNSSRTITFILSDSGIPFDPLQKKDPDITLSAEERQIGGLGIFITKKTMDSLSYRYENGENILTMQKTI